MMMMAMTKKCCCCDDDDDKVIAMMMMRTMRGAGSVGQLGREFWSQQWHWSSGFVHRIHSQCHHGGDHDHDHDHDHENDNQCFDVGVDNRDNEKFGLMLSALMRQK